MTDALLAGLLAASSLLIGAGLAMVHQVQQRTLGLIMAFGSGVLISAVAYDLVADAVEFADGRSVVSGLFVGAATFFIGDLLIERRGGGNEIRDRARFLVVRLGDRPGDGPGRIPSRSSSGSRS